MNSGEGGNASSTHAVDVDIVAKTVDAVAVVNLTHDAQLQEKAALDERMACHMEHGRPQRGAAHAHAYGDDAHILDSRIREETLVVVGAAQEHRAHGQRHYTYENQYVARPVEDLALATCIEQIYAHYGDEACIDERRRDECRGGCRPLSGRADCRPRS